jgi:prephenate dehydrogenase
MPDAPPGAPRAERAQIVGLGLIGSSLGMALRQAGFYVSGRDLDGGRELRALELAAIDAIGEDPEAAFAFVATPVAMIPEIVEKLPPSPSSARSSAPSGRTSSSCRPSVTTHSSRSSPTSRTSPRRT